jgi:hypothetical protein
MLAAGHHQMWAIFAWICAVAISPVALKYFPIPHLWIYLALSVTLFVTAALIRGARPLWFNLACIALGLSIIEYYFWKSGPAEFIQRRVNEGDVEELIYAPHDKLGWAPQAGTVARHRLSFKGELLYDVHYTIGSNGLRISSPPTTDHHASLAVDCILFFGGSFMFGQGLEDYETLPFLVGEKSRSRTYNFGVKGYGAHQMLAALQHGLVEDAIGCGQTRVSHVFYQAISDHIGRSAGPEWGWDYGPRYRLTSDGGVRLDGSFEDGGGQEERSLTQLVINQFTKSRIYKAIINGKYVKKFSQEHLDLYLGIVDAARSFVRSTYPCAEFHVLLWDEDKIDNRGITDGLREKGIDVRLMSDILPDYKLDGLNERYILHEEDVHPNALADELIAEYVVREILPRPGPCDTPPLAAG